MIVTATRRVQFCAGHRVHEHESKCRNLHGHNYVAYFTAQGEQRPLDPLGRVLEFSVLKQRLGGWIEEHWDHGFIVKRDDQEAVAALALIPEQKLYVLEGNPTAENMAKHLLEVVAPTVLDGTDVRVVKVRLEETENCSAEVEW
jgi:6-pyruvoyltetrahydropterin/6-carboxytetrahydropterin synthase